MRTIHRCTDVKTPVLSFTITVTVGYCNLNRLNAKGNIQHFLSLSLPSWWYRSTIWRNSSLCSKQLPYLVYHYLPDCSPKKDIIQILLGLTINYIQVYESRPTFPVGPNYSLKIVTTQPIWLGQMQWFNHSVTQLVNNKSYLSHIIMSDSNSSWLTTKCVAYH